MEVPSAQGRACRALGGLERRELASDFLPTPELLDRLRSNLRGPKELPLRAVLAANPGDAGHQWIAARHVLVDDDFEKLIPAA